MSAPAGLGPHNLEAERAVLGTMLISAEAASAAVPTLTEPMFFKDGHQIIFAQIQRMHAGQHPVDLITLAQALREADGLDAVGGPAALADLAEAGVLNVHLPSYITIVRDAAAKRALLQIGTDLLNDARNGRPAPDIIRVARESLQAIEALTQRGVVPTAIWGTGRDLYTRPVRATAHLIEGVIAAAGTVAITGEDKAGKSTVGLLVALCYIHGVPFLGRAIPRTGRCIIVSEEDDADELRDRMRALHQGLAQAHPTLVAPPDDPASLALVDDRVSWEAEAGVCVDDPALLDSLIEEIRRRRAIDPDGPPVLVLLDSLQAIRGGVDPGTPVGAAVIKAALRRLKAAGAVVLVVAHARKLVPGGKRTGRASQEIAGSHELPASVATTLGLMAVSPRPDSPMRLDLVTKRGKSGVLGYLTITYTPETWPPAVITVTVVEAPPADARAAASDAKVLAALPVAVDDTPGLDVMAIKAATKLAKSTVRASLKRLIAAKTAMLTGTTDNDAKLYAKNTHARA